MVMESTKGFLKYYQPIMPQSVVYRACALGAHLSIPVVGM